jgi:hypothetical protein
MKYCLSPLSANHSDYRFDRFFPERIRNLSARHWTPHLIAKEAAGFLADKPGTRILDIGSGIGKFCLVGAHHFPGNIFYGVEQRAELINLSNEAKLFFKLDNVHFIHKSFTELDLDQYDSFYFYNSFLENIDNTDVIDDYHPSFKKYCYYHNTLFNQLKKRRIGTRLVTLDTNVDQVPAEFQLVKRSANLKMWLKTK